MEYLVEFFLGLSIGERGLYTLLLIFLVYRGIIKLPFVNIGKSNTSHKDCKLYPDLVRRDQIKEEIKEIKDKTILKEQMNCLSSANARIMFLIRKVYLKLNPDEGSIQHYELILKDAKEEIKDTARKWFRENHFTSKNETKWLEYKKMRKEEMIDIPVYHLNRKHKDDLGVFNVKRSELEALNHSEVIPFALATWDTMLDDCREIARGYEQKIEELKKELDP